MLRLSYLRVLVVVSTSNFTESVSHREAGISFSQSSMWFVKFGFEKRRRVKTNSSQELYTSVQNTAFSLRLNTK